ncbi:MAG: DedA family protein [Gammaproteobacteria bacterium]|jgi:membrane protein DedA with SNARE-associated domain|nr:DedA family protein [Gammaproteobacteria bacterium]
MLESLLTSYGYPIVVIGTFLEGETVMILAGVAAHLGYLSLDWVIICGFSGTMLGDQLYFYLGRRHGKSMLAKRPSWQVPAERVFSKLRKHQNLLILSFRFIYGIRTVSPFAIGMSDVSYLRYTLFNIIGAGIWATSIASAGYYFGKAVEAVLGDIKKYEVEVMVAIILIACLVWFIRYYRQHRSEHDNA